MRGLSDRRKVGKDWFCSQSHLLSHASASRPARRGSGAGKSGIRAVGKIVKWTVIAVVLAATAAVVVGVVGLVHAADEANHAVAKSATSAKHASAEFAHVRRGMSAAQVRRLLGRPDDTQRHREAGRRQTCWYYGNVLHGTRTYEFCFQRGKLVTKTRLT